LHSKKANILNLTVEKLKELEELRKAGAPIEEYGRLKGRLLGEFEKKQ